MANKYFVCFISCRQSAWLVHCIQIECINTIKTSNFSCTTFTFPPLKENLCCFSRTHELIKSYCEEAQSFGDVPSPVGTTARQITVLLNPASNGGYELLKTNF